MLDIQICNSHLMFTNGGFWFHSKLRKSRINTRTAVEYHNKIHEVQIRFNIFASKLNRLILIARSEWRPHKVKYFSEVFTFPVILRPP